MDNKTYEEDFKMIRSAIDGAKNPMNQLGGFFKSYAIINMITVVLYLIVSLYQGFVREMYIGRMICFVYLAYYIFRMYKEEKSNTNHYYQAMLYIYGSVVVVIPVILWIAGIIGTILSIWLYYNFTGWLNILNCALPPIGIIVILDFFMKRKKYKDNMDVGDFNSFNIVGVIVGAIVANVLAWGIAAVNAMIVAAICYFIGYVRKKEA